MAQNTVKRKIDRKILAKYGFIIPMIAYPVGLFMLFLAVDQLRFGRYEFPEHII